MWASLSRTYILIFYEMDTDSLGSFFVFRVFLLSDTFPIIW